MDLVCLIYIILNDAYITHILININVFCSSAYHIPILRYHVHKYILVNADDFKCFGIWDFNPLLAFIPCRLLLFLSPVAFKKYTMFLLYVLLFSVSFDKWVQLLLKALELKHGKKHSSTKVCSSFSKWVLFVCQRDPIMNYRNLFSAWLQNSAFAKINTKSCKHHNIQKSLQSS